MTVTMSDVRAITNMLTAHFESTGRSEIDVEWDYYWDIPPKDRYDVLATPQKMHVGQLSEDLTRLKEMLREGEPIGYSFTWLGQLLIAIGESSAS